MARPVPSAFSKKIIDETVYYVQIHVFGVCERLIENSGLPQGRITKLPAQLENIFNGVNTTK